MQLLYCIFLINIMYISMYNHSQEFLFSLINIYSGLFLYISFRSLISNHLELLKEVLHFLQNTLFRTYIISISLQTR